ncbi:MAG: MlaE family ABC transporter permease [Syntrophobacteraceae bacterium]
MQADIAFTRPSEGELEITLSGSWTFSDTIPEIEKTTSEIGSSQRTQRISFHTGNLTGWDSSLLVFLSDIYRYCSDNRIKFDDQGLPPGITRLLKLVFSVPPNKDARKKQKAKSLLVLVGSETAALVRSTGEMLDFLGETFLAFTRVFTGKARFRRSDLLFFIQECGHEAVPIVSLISALVGLILAFTGAVQLLLFGAQIYVASLVGISMVRVMGAIMVGIIMAGRTGAAYAAQLGTMQVNEEIDAFRTLGISPVEFLVLPRVLALTIMMPLLCIYADLMGIIGGLIVGVTMLDLNAWEYINMTRESVALKHFWIGLIHAAVFGALVSMAGCMRGMQCGRSSQAVGAATTSAVVTGIVSIIIATAIITVICNVLGV